MAQTQQPAPQSKDQGQNRALIGGCENPKCKNQCDLHFTQIQKNRIQTEFQSKISEKDFKKNFFLTNITKELKAIQTIYIYHLEDIVVCKHMFFVTLGLKKIDEKKIKEALEGKEITEYRHSRQHTESFNNKIQEFVESFQPTHSHYNYVKCPNKRYIPSSYEMTYSRLYKEFAAKHGFSPNDSHKGDNQCSIDYFLKYVKKRMNVGFEILANDKCDKCYTWKLHQKDGSVCNCKYCSGFAQHQNDIKLARTEYIRDKKMDKVTDTMYFACDAQKTFCIPKLESQNSFWSERLLTINQTFSQIGTDGQSFCLLSNNYETCKNSKEYISLFVKFLQLDFVKNCSHLIVWSDNCGSQNKNWNLYANLVRIINDTSIPQQKITIKYLEKGHTYNACDSIHGVIANLFKNREIYSPKHCLEIIGSCRENNKAIQITHKDVYDFTKGSISQPFKFKTVKQYEVRKNDTKSYVKFTRGEDFQHPFKIIDPNSAVPQFLASLPKQSSPIGVTSARLKSLKSLQPCIPIEYRSFIDEMILTKNSDENTPNN